MLRLRTRTYNSKSHNFYTIIRNLKHLLDTGIREYHISVQNDFRTKIAKYIRKYLHRGTCMSDHTIKSWLICVPLHLNIVHNYMYITIYNCLKLKFTVLQDYWLEFGGTQAHVFIWISTSGRKFCRTLPRFICITLVLN